MNALSNPGRPSGAAPRGAQRRYVTVPRPDRHPSSISPDDYKVVNLSRAESRRLAALLLYQADLLGDTRVRPADESGGDELNCA